MDPLTLMFVLAGLLLLLIVLVGVYVWMGRIKPLISEDTNQPLTFGELKALIHNKTSKNFILNRAVEEIMERFIEIDGKERTIEEFTSLIETLCFHPNTDSKVILRFDKALRSANPRYKDRIEKSIKSGLAERDKRSKSKV